MVEPLGGAAAATLGLAAGSLANVAIHRWPRGSTLGSPRRSHCASCQEPISWRDNVPVASWMALRGRCRTCDAAISVRYPIVEIATAGLFVLTYASFGVDPLLPAMLVLMWALVVATAIDLEHRIIPNRLTLRLPIVLALLIGAGAAASQTHEGLVRAGVAAIAVPGAMLLISELFRLLRGQQGIGMGDIKLAVSLGLGVGYLGWWHVVVFAYASIIAAVVVAALLLMLGRARLASRIPFGPYLAAGTMLAVLAGDETTRLLAQLLGW